MGAGHGGPAASSKSTTGEEAGQEVEEILAVGDAVAVEVGAALEERAEEIEKVLAVERIVAVEVARAQARQGDVVQHEIVGEGDAADVHDGDLQRGIGGR